MGHRLVRTKRWPTRQTLTGQLGLRYGTQNDTTLVNQQRLCSCRWLAKLQCPVEETALEGSHCHPGKALVLINQCARQGGGKYACDGLEGGRDMKSLI